jgi:hypothetical protein
MAITLKNLKKCGKCEMIGGIVSENRVAKTAIKLKLWKIVAKYCNRREES